ncbi:21855_t:CDS:2, partial [Dentiscutata erythropus]
YDTINEFMSIHTDDGTGSGFDLGIVDSEGDCYCDQYAYKKQIKEDPKKRSYLNRRAFFEMEEYEIFQIVEKS